MRLHRKGYGTGFEATIFPENPITVRSSPFGIGYKRRTKDIGFASGESPKA
jgi:hypothetical protein